MSQPIRILIIDDDPIMTVLTRASLQKYAGDWSLAITSLPNGAQGLDYISAAQPLPDIILLDIHMPVMGGIDFLREYEKLALPAVSPLIYILSTVAGQVTVTESTELVRDYLEKPLTEGHVRDIIQDYHIRFCS